MFKNLTFVILLAASMLAVGCGGSATGNSANTNSNAAVKVDPANLPPGLSTVPVQPSNASTPGIPAVIANMPKGATPTPGIPSEAELKKKVKPGVTPTPGIPSEEEMRRQMGTQPKSPNAASTDAPPPSMMKKNTNKLPTKP